MADNALVVNTGTALTMASDDISSVHYPRVKISLGADGAAADWTGNIPTGTITALAKGTISVGTMSMTTGTLNGGTLSNLNFGTIDTFYRHTDAFATTVSTGTNVLGTIRAAVSGSIIYVTDLVVSAGSATNVVVASGGTSTPILGTLHLAANGGAVMNFVTPIRTASGSALVYKQSAAVSPLSITANGYID